MSWMDERAEQAMREGTQKIMEEAQKRAKAEFKEVGRWTITMSGNNKVTKEDIDSFMSKLIEFAKKADIDAPSIMVSIDPVIEKKDEIQ